MDKLEILTWVDEKPPWEFRCLEIHLTIGKAVEMSSIFVNASKAYEAISTSADATKIVIFMLISQASKPNLFSHYKLTIEEAETKNNALCKMFCE